MKTIYIENKPYQVEDGQNMLQVSLSLGFNLPYFCWHQALGSVGACRQCAVKQFKDENDTRGKLVMACMTPAEEGTRISINDPDAVNFRERITEWMMVHHPHDCPVCDEGGECHLQDMTVMTGHSYRRYHGRKRTFHNQNLGPFVNHEMNRCIQCYRCVRYYRDYAGGRDFDVFGIHDNVYFGRYTDGPLESEFSGNLVEVCPTGVFTDKTLKKHYTRKWDLQTAPSICVNCSVGCNTIPGERYGQLRRLRNRYNGHVNGHFLCDRGRYGYEFVNSERRIRQPMLRRPGDEAGQDGRQAMEAITKENALETASKHLGGQGKVIGIGSPRASLEANYAMRVLVGEGNFYQGVPELEVQLVREVLDILQNGPARTPSLSEVGECDAVLVLGEDVSNTAPMMALALRQSIRQQPIREAQKLRIARWDDAALREVIQGAKGPFYQATATATRLDDVATKTYHAAPDDLARLGFAIAAELGAVGSAPANTTDTEKALAEEIARVLREAERPLVVSGTSLANKAIIQSAANVAWALCAQGRDARLSYAVSETNSLGTGLMGGKGLESAFQATQQQKPDAIVILENDLYRRADRATVDRFLASAGQVISLDSLMNETSRKSDIALPAATFAEGDGTLVNNEGRAQRFYQVFMPAGEIQESWRWACDLIEASGRLGEVSWSNLDKISGEMAAAMPVFGPVLEIAPPATFRLAGQKIPRQPARWSGRTAIQANINVSEPKPPTDPDSPFDFSMEGFEGQPPSALIPRFWAPGWNSIQSLNKFQEEVGGPLRGGDPGKRLVEPARVEKINYFNTAPLSFKPTEGQWLVIPLYHVFGSDEVSMLTPGIAELAPRPYLGLNPEDAAIMQASDGEMVELSVGEAVERLPVKLVASLPRGTAGLPVGLPGVPWISPLALGRLAKSEPPEVKQ